MGCNSEYLKQNSREAELQRAARLLVFVHSRLGTESTPELVKASADYYCRADYVPELCQALKAMTDEQVDSIVYNGRNPLSRDLASWWEQHQLADKQREMRERQQRLQAKGVPAAWVSRVDEASNSLAAAMSQLKQLKASSKPEEVLTAEGLIQKAQAALNELLSAGEKAPKTS